MIKYLVYTLLLAGFIGVVTGFSGCSAERGNPFSKSYHNTAARYNAHFYAKMRLQEIEQTLWTNHQNDYDNVLRIYPEFDTIMAKSYEALTEDIIKKSSIAIQRHKNSKWVDDCYILVGQARHYDVDFPNAIETFKFVNTHSENEHKRHRALIHLMRSFIEAEEMNNALAVSDFLQKQPLNKKNTKNYMMTRAYFYQKREDYKNMETSIAQAAPLLKKKEKKARTYFILGQLQQINGEQELAFDSYRTCIKTNPPYELDFHARLNMAQVTQFAKGTDVKTARKHFRKLLNDKKNEEYKDRIYYEMANFELRQNRMDEAIQFYKKSAWSSTRNNKQKGQAYLKLGEIHYDSLKKYELAKAYYDSTISVLPKDFKNYEKIKARQEILADFVAQINIISEKDSLLSLVKMDSVSLMAYLQDYVDAETEKADKKAAEERRQARRAAAGSGGVASPFDDRSGGGSTSWYFGNPSAVAQGQNEFRRKWGNRTLEDNWRRSRKQTTISDQMIGAAEGGAEDRPSEGAEGDSRAEGLNAVSLYNQLPHSVEAQQAALDQIEEAKYQLGSIYNFKLLERDNARTTFNSLLDRFPESEHKPEVLYLLYIIHTEYLKDGGEGPFKDQLLSTFPNTIYAKLVINPNYREESDAALIEMQKLYKVAYELYETKEYDRSLAIIEDAINKYGEVDFSPRLHLLRILIIGRTDDINKYRFELSQLIEKYPDAEITPYAQTLLKASREFEERMAKSKGVIYIPDFEQEHFFVLLYPKGDKNTDPINKFLDEYHKENFPENKLSSGNLMFDDTYNLINVTPFKDKKEAQNYYFLFNSISNIEKEFPDLEFYKFVITKDNFDILYRTKAVDNYLGFFQKNY